VEELFSGQSSGSLPCQQPGVYGKVLAGGWSRGLAGKWPSLIRIIYETMEVISIASLDKWPDNTERKPDHVIISVR